MDFCHKSAISQSSVALLGLFILLSVFKLIKPNNKKKISRDVRERGRASRSDVCHAVQTHAPFPYSLSQVVLIYSPYARPIRLFPRTYLARIFTCLSWKYVSHCVKKVSIWRMSSSAGWGIRTSKKTLRILFTPLRNKIIGDVKTC